MNYDYSFDATYMHKKVGNDAYYQYDFCRIFLCKEYNDSVLKVQDSLLEKFKDDEKFQNILKKAAQNNFNMPIKMDEKNIFCFFSVKKLKSVATTRGKDLDKRSAKYPDPVPISKIFLPFSES